MLLSVGVNGTPVDVRRAVGVLAFELDPVELGVLAAGEEQVFVPAPLDDAAVVTKDPDGKIHHIAENAVPQSLAVISSDGPVRGTLEIAAGTVEKLDIHVGDVVHQRIFGNAP